MISTRVVLNSVLPSLGLFPQTFSSISYSSVLLSCAIILQQLVDVGLALVKVANASLVGDYMLFKPNHAGLCDKLITSVSCPVMSLECIYSLSMVRCWLGV